MTGVGSTEPARSAGAGFAGAGVGKALTHQVRAEQLVFWRSKEAALFIFLLPVLLFLLLGSVYNGEIYGVPAPEALLAGLIGYGCANTAFAGLAIQLVLRRENGKDLVFPFRYSDVKKGEKLEQNIILKGGDVVVVP